MITENQYQFKGTKGEWGLVKVFETPHMVKDSSNGDEWYALSHWLKGGNTIIGDVKYSTAKGGYRNVDSIEEFEANCHLIAAAPELLGALIRVYNAAKEADLLETLGEEEHEYMQSAIHKALNIQ